MSTTVLSRGGCGDEAEKRSAACNADLRTISPLVNLELNGKRCANWCRRGIRTPDAPFEVCPGLRTPCRRIAPAASPEFDRFVKPHKFWTGNHYAACRRLSVLPEAGRRGLRLNGLITLGLTAPASAPQTASWCGPRSGPSRTRSPERRRKRLCLRFRRRRRSRGTQVRRR